MVSYYPVLLTLAFFSGIVSLSAFYYALHLSTPLCRLCKAPLKTVSKYLPLICSNRECESFSTIELFKKNGAKK